MHTSVRGIVNYNDKIVLIHRIKTKDDGTVRDYYVTPGGKIEENESHEEALRREIKEELGIEIEIKGLCLELDDRDYNDSFQYFYNCNYKSGELGTEADLYKNPLGIKITDISFSLENAAQNTEPAKKANTAQQNQKAGDK